MMASFVIGIAQELVLNVQYVKNQVFEHVTPAHDGFRNTCRFVGDLPSPHHLGAIDEVKKLIHTSILSIASPRPFVLWPQVNIQQCNEHFNYSQEDITHTIVISRGIISCYHMEQRLKKSFVLNYYILLLV
jgi:hypothetical protein